MYELMRITEPTELIAAALECRPAGPGFCKEDAQRAAALIVDASSFSDPGPDFTRWRLVDASDTELATTIINGF